MKNKKVLFACILFCGIFITISGIFAQGVYVTLDNVIKEECFPLIPQKPWEVAGFRIRLEFSGFPMHEPETVYYWWTNSTGGSSSGTSTIREYEQVDSYHGKVWIEGDQLWNVEYTWTFQIELNELKSNKKSITFTCHYSPD